MGPTRFESGAINFQVECSHISSCLLIFNCLEDALLGCLTDFSNIFHLFYPFVGSITRQELGDVIRSLGQNPTEEELCKMITEVDANGNGNIDFNEFTNLMTPQMQVKGYRKEIKKKKKKPSMQYSNSKIGLGLN